MSQERKTVGYVRSLTGNPYDREMQMMFIRRYSILHGLEMPMVFEDMGSVRQRRRSDVDKAKKLGIVDPKRSKCLPSRDDMLLMAMENKIAVVLVDRKERLYRNQKDKRLLDAVLERHHIEIIEAGIQECVREDGKKNVAFYHYYIPNPQKSGIRTANLIKDIEAFYEMVAVHPDWGLGGLYIDSSAFRRTEFPKLQERSDIDVIVCKYFYHINRKTLAFLQIVQEMNVKGITLVSTEEGVIRYDSQGWNMPHEGFRAAIYDCSRSEQEKIARTITKKKLDLFCRIVGIDANRTESYEEETNTPAEAFDKLVDNVSRYDVIIVDSFAKLGESVNELMECVRRVRIPIYSLKEGVLYLDGKDRIV